MNNKSRGSPRKFAEKIALLNKKEAEATAEFEKILKEVEETTRAPPLYWALPQRSSSFSNWHTCPQTIQQQQAQQQQQQQQYQQSNYLTQPMQFSQAPMNQLHQQRQQVINTARHQHQQHQLQHQHQHQDQQRQQRQQQPTIYVNHQDPRQQDDYMVASSNLSPGAIQPISIEVPNIEIFPIDDEYQQQQQSPNIPTTATQGILTNVHYRNDCSSPPPISAARSMPNIATLSVSPSSTGHMIPQPVVANQRMAQPPTSSNHLNTAQPTTSMLNGSNEKYPYNNSLNADYYNQNDDYCSLPAFREPVPSLTRNDQNRQSQTHIQRSDSWQQPAVASSPNSATTTPPLGQQQLPSPTANHQSMNLVQFVADQQSPQTMTAVHSSPDTSPRRQQHSPQTLHQDHHYYPQQQGQGQIVRANSTNVINKYPNNNDLLEAPRINNGLSKSIDTSYGYIDNYVSTENFSPQMNQQSATIIGRGGEGNGVGDRGDYVNNDSNIQYVDINPSARSCSQNNIENIHSESKSATNLYVDTNQHMLDSSQYSFFQ